VYSRVENFLEEVETTTAEERQVIDRQITFYQQEVAAP
jgi:hypothetical protein